KNESIACGNAIPFYWDGDKASLPEGWDKVFEKGILDFQNNIQPNSLSALSIVIHPEFRGKGLSERMVNEMKSLDIQSKFKNMVASVRPSLHSIYHLILFESYLNI